MVSTKEMKEAEGKEIRLYGVNGKIIQDHCCCYYWGEDEGEEPSLQIGKHWEIPQSQIERIEILDQLLGVIKYILHSNNLVIGRPDYKISTMFKPEDKILYYMAELKKYIGDKDD